jgi:hypothetical protein
MKERTLEYMEEMGQTGAGIQREGDINMDDPNSFTTKWGTYIISLHPDVPPLTPISYSAQIKEAWPWFFEHRELIGERPNSIPTGIGNSGSAVDLTVLGQSDEDDEADEEGDDEEGGGGSEDGFDADHLSAHQEDVDGEDEEELDEVDVPEADVSKGKRKAMTPSSKPRKKTSAQANSSTPVVLSKAKPSKPKTVMERFAEVAESEEVTAQKRADVEQVKSRTELARVKAKGHVALEKEKRKMERLKLKVEMKKLELQHSHHLEELCLRNSFATSSQAHYSNLPNSFLDGNNSFNPSAGPSFLPASTSTPQDFSHAGSSLEETGTDSSFNNNPGPNEFTFPFNPVSSDT